MWLIVCHSVVISIEPQTYLVNDGNGSPLVYVLRMLLDRSYLDLFSLYKSLRPPSRHWNYSNVVSYTVQNYPITHIRAIVFYNLNTFRETHVQCVFGVVHCDRHS